MLLLKNPLLQPSLNQNLESSECLSLITIDEELAFNTNLRTIQGEEFGYGPVRLSYEMYYFSERTMFFSHNKSVNSIFNHDFLSKRTGSMPMKWETTHTHACTHAHLFYLYKHLSETNMRHDVKQHAIFLWTCLGKYFIKKKGITRHCYKR